jgi:DNA processing protein
MSNDEENDVIQEVKKKNFPSLLSEMADPPEKLRFRGKLPPSENTLLCVVGSRKYSPYGKEVCEMLISALRGTNISIVSGLALGIDGVAHRAALDAGLHTLAVPGSGLAWDVLYPRSNFALGKDIINAGGGFLSEFDDDHRARPESFPQRNRIMAGMSHATLVIEAGERSGTLITARLALEYNRDVCVVPANIFSDSSAGSNDLMRQGAFPITKPDDLYEILEIKNEDRSADISSNLSDEETEILNILSEPKSKDELLTDLSLPAYKANILLSSMEIKGLITERLGKIYKKV